MTAELIKKMVLFYKGSQHDIDHFIKVWTYAKTIGELEGLDAETQLILEVAAIVHDIACPALRDKYGHCNGKQQEEEGPAMAVRFLAGSGLTDAQIERVAFLVGHHHTPDAVDGYDYQILLEADCIVNAAEQNYNIFKSLNAFDSLFRTESGKALYKSIFGIPDLRRLFSKEIPD